MRVLVTGGAGFIGSHIVDRFVDEGNQVYIADNLSTGHLNNLQSEYEHLYTTIDDAIQDVKYDLIVHAGMPSSSPMYRIRPDLVYEVLKEGMLLFKQAKRTDTKVILISTSSIYNGNPIPWREDMPIYVSDFYTEARYYLERISIAFNINCTILRLFSVYGEREEFKGKFANIASQFTWCFLKDEQPIIYGDGNQTRDFIYVGDVVEAVIKAIDVPGISIFNVGTGKNYSFNDVIEILGRLYNKNIEPKYIENPIENYVYHTLADMELSEKWLGFKPKVEFEEGLKRIKKYYSERIKSGLEKRKK